MFVWEGCVAARVARFAHELTHCLASARRRRRWESDHRVKRSGSLGPNKQRPSDPSDGRCENAGNKRTQADSKNEVKTLLLAATATATSATSTATTAAATLKIFEPLDHGIGFCLVERIVTVCVDIGPPEINSPLRFFG